MNNLEYFWFLPYSIKVRDFLQKSLYLSSYHKDENTKVFYTTPSKAFARFIVPVINGSNLSPTITFHLTSQEINMNEMPGGFFKHFKYSNKNDLWESHRTPLPFTLTYRVTMWAARQSDMDILKYQAITSAPFNKKYVDIVDGQFMELESKMPTDESNLEPGEAQDVSVRVGFDIVIPRAYLPLDYEEFKHTIRTYKFYNNVGGVDDDNIESYVNGEEE